MNSYFSIGAGLTTLDFLACGFLFAAWLGIGWITENPPSGKPSVSVLMKRFRHEWMHQFITRDPRIFDGNILSTLREGTAFFASACMIAIGGTLALIGNTERLHGIVEDFDLEHGSAALWELKLLIPMFFVVNAFLKFVWSHRLFGYCAIMMAAVPNDPEHSMAHDRAHQAAELNITAARSFNAGLRSVYFAIGGLAWLAGGWPLIFATAIVLFVSWRREFASNSRRVVMRSLPNTGGTGHVDLPKPPRDKAGP